MSDNRLNRCGSSTTPWKLTSDTDFGSSEYSRAFTPCASRTSVIDNVATDEQRPGIRQSDSEYNKAFGPKAPYARPTKPLWMVNKNKSSFDLKLDPNARFEGKTSYMETYAEKKTISSQEKESNTNELVSSGDDNNKNNVAAQPDSITVIKTENPDTSGIGDTGKCETKPDEQVLLKENGGGGGGGEESPEIQYLYSTFNYNPISNPTWQSSTTTDVKLETEKDESATTNSKVQTSEQKETPPSEPVSLPPAPPHIPILLSPRHGRKKVENEPALNATPGLKFFINSISRR